MGSTNRDWYLKDIKRLDHNGKPDTSSYYYTSPDYINLYSGKEEPDSKRMDNYYGFVAAPNLLLIDKKGNIYSGSLPLLRDGLNDPQIPELIKLIEHALAEKD